MEVPESINWRGEEISRIMLGTVQLGMNYGIANVHGKPDQDRATAIVAAAWECGVRHFDTAQAYDDSEAVLGEALRRLGIAGEAQIGSKLSPFMDPLDLSSVEASIERSFKLLGVQQIWCMLFHDPDWLDHWDKGLGELLCRYRDTGRIRHLGASIFTPSQAPRCLDHDDMEALQVAANAWDRRMNRLGVFEMARKKDRLCCVRSIYLKGLLTLEPTAVAQKLPFAEEASKRWHALAKAWGIPPIELAVRYAMSLNWPLVVGAEDPAQVRDTVRLAQQAPLGQEAVDEIERTLEPVLSEQIVHPHHWEN